MADESKRPKTSSNGQDPELEKRFNEYKKEFSKLLAKYKFAQVPALKITKNGIFPMVEIIDDKKDE